MSTEPAQEELDLDLDAIRTKLNEARWEGIVSFAVADRAVADLIGEVARARGERDALRDVHWQLVEAVKEHADMECIDCQDALDAYRASSEPASPSIPPEEK